MRPYLQEGPRHGAARSDRQDIYSRLSISQVFATDGGLRFSVVVNHFKSKGGCLASGDIDNGQGCWNEKRTRQADALLDYVNRLQKRAKLPTS